ncbi:hypothetical protein CR513_62609, partial [Mucuna pruriens]
MRSQANKHRREVLSRRYYSPNQIMQKIGTVAYKLDLPEDNPIHPVFHVLLLIKAIGANQQPQPLLHMTLRPVPIPTSILQKVCGQVTLSSFNMYI